ncbi:hypothetical protein JTE90_018675 [Oedothorax gibbosus]|uniref:Uncharacterized protein n=1 Tax=Oedothorax gibbosus TaxID=931172 RepID=A0AAV6V234_9ARAC|nr:hypothetical protein JTE90_018675 [Oedothorax gibbosus]
MAVSQGGSGGSQIVPPTTEQNLDSNSQNTQTQTLSMNASTVIPPVDISHNAPNIAVIQTWIPVYDGLSPVTPKYLIDSVERLTKDTTIPDLQKIQLVISKIKGEPLAKIITNIDIIQATQFQNFKEEFLDFFSENDSLLLRQLNLNECKQKVDEDIKSFGVRLTQATRQFFGNIDIEKEDTKKIFDQTRLARLIDGVLPAYKLQLLTKDVKNFEEAIKFIQLLQANRQLIDSQAICAIKTAHNGQTDQTQQLIHNLDKQMRELTIQNQILSKKFEENRDNLRENCPQTNQFSRENEHKNTQERGSRHNSRDFRNRQNFSPTQQNYSTEPYYETRLNNRGRNRENVQQNYRQPNFERGRQPFRLPRGQFRNTRGYYNNRSSSWNRQGNYNNFRPRDHSNERFTARAYEYNGDEYNRGRPIRGRSTRQVFGRGVHNA